MSYLNTIRITFNVKYLIIQPITKVLLIRFPSRDKIRTLYFSLLSLIHEPKRRARFRAEGVYLGGLE